MENTRVERYNAIVKSAREQLDEWVNSFSDEGSWGSAPLEDAIRVPGLNDLTGIIYFLKDNDSDFEDDGEEHGDDEVGVNTMLLAVTERPLPEEMIPEVMKRLALYECPLSVNRCQECLFIVVGNNKMYADGISFDAHQMLLGDTYESYCFPNLEISFQ